jgi:YGGT family
MASTSPVHPRRRALVLGARVLVWTVYAYVIVTEVILGLGFLLLLFGANPDASFVAWAYRSLERAMEPFRGMFTPIELGLGGNDDVGAVLDTSILFAMLVYAIIAWFLSWLLEQVTGYLTRLDADRQRVASQAQQAPPSGAAATYSLPTSPPPSRPPGAAPGPTSAPPPRPPGAAS